MTRSGGELTGLVNYIYGTAVWGKKYIETFEFDLQKLQLNF